MDQPDPLDVLDWRRRVAELYRAVRAVEDPRAAWALWRSTRDGLFASHPASPLPADEQGSFRGLDFFDYDPAMRVAAEVTPAAEVVVELAAGDGARYAATRFARAGFELAGEHRELDLHWLHGYAGGVLLPFTDQTSGHGTYAGGRYLLDTIKGADLGGLDGGLTIDFNFAYNPSCSYDPSWSCPLPAAGNRLSCTVAAGERAPSPAASPPREVVDPQR